MRHTLSTSHLPEPERLECWQRITKGIFSDVSFRCENLPSEPFDGQVSHSRLGPLDLFELNTAAHRLQRTHHHNPAPALILTLQLEGEGAFSQGGRCDVLQPGDFALLDSCRPFEMQFSEPTTLYVMRLPWPLVRQQLLSPALLTGLGIDGTSGSGFVASTLIQAFAREAPALPHYQSERLLSSLIDTVNTAAMAHLSENSCRTSDYRAYQQSRIRDYIEQNLHNPELNPAMIASQNQMSLRSLNKLFETQEHSISRLLIERRLEKCSSALTDPVLAGKSITEIAYSWGFKSSSHFSRTFREKFGTSPRQWREEGKQQGM